MSALLSEVETFAKITFKHVVPYKAVNALKRNIRKLDRKWRSSAGQKTEVHDIAQLKRDLERSGLDPDRDIFIHASFSKIGTDLKAEAVIDMILDFIGPDTTVLMPAYAMPDNMLAWMADPAPFDVTRSPSMMGILSEIFRRRQDTHRSAHPTHSVCAWGKNAKWYVDEHHLCPAPCAAGSPFAKLADSKGQILCIGTNVGKITAYHVIEDLDEGFPIETCLPQPFTKTVIKDGKKFDVVTRVFNPALSPWRIDNFKPKMLEFRSYLKKYGCLRSAKLGKADMDIVDAAGFLDMLRDLTKHSVTIYHRPAIGLIRKICKFPY